MKARSIHSTHNLEPHLHRLRPYFAIEVYYRFPVGQWGEIKTGATASSDLYLEHYYLQRIVRIVQMEYVS
jgi:hypothetical protein